MIVQGKGAVDVLLAESFKELVLQHPIEKITIKEITDKAGVIRPTFYNHFQDKYELLEYIISAELLAPIRPLIENQMIYEALLLLFTNIEKDKEFYMQAVRLEGQNSFESVVRKCVKEILLSIIQDNEKAKRIPPKFEWLTAERIAEYYALSMCSVAIEWIKTGLTASARKLTEAYIYIMKHSVDEILFGA